MGLDRSVIIFDFETDGLDVNTCNPVELAAIAIDLRNLQIIPDSEFSVFICPDDVDKPDYIKNHYQTIKWHADLHKTTPKDIVACWKKKGIKEKIAWEMFMEYCKKYRLGTKYNQSPLPGGQNIVNFDIPILNRLCAKYKTSSPFPKIHGTRDNFDLMNIAPFWFLFSSNPPENFKLDTMRDYFGMSKKGAHEAITDVRQCSELIIKFLHLYKTLTPRIEMLNRQIQDEVGEDQHPGVLVSDR